MSLLRNLMLLCIGTMTMGQEYYGHQNPDGTKLSLNYDQIAKLLQTPLFRTNPAEASSEQISSYLPTNYAVTEILPQNTETQLTAASSLSPAPVPALVLQAPRAEATDSYAAHRMQAAPIQSYEAQQSQPYVQIQPEAILHYASPTAQLTNFAPKYLIQQSSVNKYLPLNPLSKQLDLPLPSEPSRELQTPLFEPYNTQFNSAKVPVRYTQIQQSPQNVNSNPYPTISQSLEAPKKSLTKPLSVPTNLFPKKYNINLDSKPKKTGKTAPGIEIAGDKTVGVSTIKKTSKPQKLVLSPHAAQSEEKENIEKNSKDLSHEKQRQKFEESQQKNKSRKENEGRKQQQLIDQTIARASGAKNDNKNNEQEASASGFHESGTSFHAAPPHHQASGLGLGDVSHGEDAQRTEFRIHGQEGPNSYKFGFDTGKGDNRQFRYEERNNDGYVKGHYGFYDKHGRLQIVNYDAHPHHGFNAEASFDRD